MIFVDFSYVTNIIYICFYWWFNLSAVLLAALWDCTHTQWCKSGRWMIRLRVLLSLYYWTVIAPGNSEKRRHSRKVTVKKPLKVYTLRHLSVDVCHVISANPHISKHMFPNERTFGCACGHKARRSDALSCQLHLKVGDCVTVKSNMLRTNGWLEAADWNWVAAH